MFQGITQVSVPVLSPSWELLLVLTAADMRTTSTATPSDY